MVYQQMSPGTVVRPGTACCATPPALCLGQLGHLSGLELWLERCKPLTPVSGHISGCIRSPVCHQIFRESQILAFGWLRTTQVGCLVCPFWLQDDLSGISQARAVQSIGGEETFPQISDAGKRPPPLLRCLGDQQDHGGKIIKDGGVLVNGKAAKPVTGWPGTRSCWSVMRTGSAEAIPQNIPW